MNINDDEVEDLEDEIETEGVDVVEETETTEEESDE